MAMPSAPPVRPAPYFPPGAQGPPVSTAPAPPYGTAPYGQQPPGGPPRFGPPPLAAGPSPTPAPGAQPGTNPRATSALIGAVVGAIVAALVAALIVVATTDSNERAASTTQPTPTAVSTGGSSTGGGSGLDVQAVLKTAEPSVVSVQTDLGEGSGFVISADGFVVTNYHVIEGATSVRVRFADDQIADAEVIGSFPDNDVALIKVADRTDLVPAKLGSSDALLVGDNVLAIGNALGLGAAPSVTLGIVSAKDRKVPIDGAVLDHLLQTDAAINHGNSGGPLVNAKGEVVGINTLVAEGAQSIGFAISIDSVKPLIEDLKAGRGEITPNTAFLGVSSIAVDDPTIDPQQLKDEGVTSSFGALIVDVTADSAADKSGLAVGDVITAADGAEVRSADDVGAAVRAHKAGETMAITYERRGEPRTVQVTLGRRGR